MNLFMLGLFSGSELKALVTGMSGFKELGWFGAQQVYTGSK